MTSASPHAVAHRLRIRTLEARQRVSARSGDDADGHGAGEYGRERSATGRPDELEAFELATLRAFHEDPRPEDMALGVRLLEAERTLAIREEGEIVATSAAVTRDLTLPGGVAVPAGGVTAVGVAPGHTRRGHLGTLMRAQLEEVRAAGETAGDPVGVGGRDLRPLRLRDRDPARRTTGCGCRPPSCAPTPRSRSSGRGCTRTRAGRWAR